VPWIALYVGLAVIGLAVLAVLTVRLWRQVKQFGRDVSAAGAKIAAINEALTTVSPPPRH
jgi:uncharacterized membrane protein